MKICNFQLFKPDLPAFPPAMLCLFQEMQRLLDKMLGLSMKAHRSKTRTAVEIGEVFGSEQLPEDFVDEVNEKSRDFTDVAGTDLFQNTPFSVVGKMVLGPQRSPYTLTP